MTDRADFLFELGTEELPPKALPLLADALKTSFLAALDSAGLQHAGCESYAAPRRLSLIVRELAFQAPNRSIERKGPALAAAYDANGQPTRALEGFAKSCGVPIDALTRVETDKGTWLSYRATEPGQTAAEILPVALTRALDELPTPKRMRWGSRDAEFIRPVHWLVALHGTAIVPMTLFGLAAGRHTVGHRFHHPGSIELGSPADYLPRLANTGFVLADFAARRDKIRGQIEATAAPLGGRAVIDDALLDEVTALVEWPVAVAGQFEASFLAVPHEALISTMQGNQKYFPLVDADGQLLPWFITIANIDSKNPAAVRAGNERVIRPRFADALFFWNEDRKRPLDSHLEALKSVIFQQRLGSLFDKTLRIERLAAQIAEALDADVPQTRRAARLCKCDLQSKMVGEFPELQGIMGRYLATHDGEHPEIAQAQDDYYKPRRAGDALPSSAIAQALALADRLDTLVGIFAIGQAPTGAKDPFALRRAALGVVRILVERQRPLDLRQLIEQAASGLHAELPEASQHIPAVCEFILERYYRYCLERGVRADVFNAVAATGCTRLTTLDRRIQAVTDFLALPDAEALTAGNKRIHNILKKLETPITTAVSAGQLVEPAEQALWAAINQTAPQIEAALGEEDEPRALSALAALRAPIDQFFDQVMVMAEDAALRRNRLALLGQTASLFNGVADLTLINPG
ncbi:glycine--tRNA ligase subunit beta [Halothiobacillus sp. DCM-1]|uniref:glycine--tRNA ligase subunit beta n=1 Tax=Halothiobacillus sp. DCM-1 TaxID=3112558 RepID=UPI003244302D